MTRASRGLWIYAAVQAVILGVLVAAIATRGDESDLHTPPRSDPQPPPTLRSVPSTTIKSWTPVTTDPPLTNRATGRITPGPERPVWSNCRPGWFEASITIPEHMYPDEDGVRFFVGFDPDRTDKRGPRVGDVFHATRRNLKAGEILTATWSNDHGAQFDSWCEVKEP